LDEAMDFGQDAVVISNRNDQHIEVALAAARKGLHIYIEKPLSNNLTNVEELKDLEKRNSLVIEIGCMMRFHPNLILINKLLSDGIIGKVYFARACVGQYLPDWRPGQDYRQLYSAKAEYGGGVLLDLIHELDYLLWWLGKIKEVSAVLAHQSDLEIETEDVALLSIQFQNGILAQVQMDYLRPFYHRTCEIVGSRGVIYWDYSKGTVFVKIKGEGKDKVFSVPDGFDRNDMFLDHMKFFIKRVKEGGEPAVSLEDGIHSLKVALAAHQSSKEKRTVKI
jgi:predicted dehydrogenase